MWDKNREVMLGCQAQDLLPTTVGAPGVTVMPNGVEYTIYADKGTMEIFVGKQVAVVRTADHMVERVVKGRADGSFVEEFPSGKVITHRPDGTTVTVELDEWHPNNEVTNDGRHVEKRPNGLEYTIYNDKKTFPGTTLEKFAGGKVLVNRDGPDGLVLKVAEGQDDGSVKESLPDGTVVLYRPDGTHRTTKLDGTVTEAKAKATAGAKEAEEAKAAAGAATAADKVELEAKAAVKAKEAAEAKAAADVAAEAAVADDGEVSKQCESGTTYIIHPDKSTLETFAGRQTLVDRAADHMVTRVVEVRLFVKNTLNGLHEDGTNIEYMPDGRVITQGPSGPSTTTEAEQPPKREIKRNADGTFIFS